jgi:uroporphyrinogen decarboxylase
MSEGVGRFRDAYNRVPGAPIYHREFGYYCLEAWKQQGLPEDANLADVFHFNEDAIADLSGLGWCEAAFMPAFPQEVIEDRGETEVARDHAGRHVLFFKGRRSGFMPEYIEHPVKDRKSWAEQVKWRLDPDTQERMEQATETAVRAARAAAEGKLVTQRVIGGYMYLRSLVGPEDLLYMFYDDPELIHDCMKTWFELADRVVAKHQEHVTVEQLFLAEDICYNAGPLIGPDMMREFLFPYYQQLIANLRSRQIDPNRHLHIQIDTDGQAESVIEVYREIGMDAMSPFEVASGSDVVAIGRRYPDLIMSGGIDKRILARRQADIDRMVERIVPAMRERGGYIPTCDHGVPEEVPLDNYLHYRQRMVELGG